MPTAARARSFSYKKLDYQRIDKKSLNITISERTTVNAVSIPKAISAASSAPCAKKD